MIQDHSPIVIDTFNGLFGIDSYNDSVPMGYFINELNTISYGDEVKTRDGFASSHTTASCLRFRVYRRQGEASRILYLNNSEQIIDLTTATIILTVTGMTDFAMEVVNNTAFISPHNGVSGISGEFVYIYTGTGTARKAAGAIPTGTPIATISATAGVIEAGTHIFAWVNETTTGFVTAPGTAVTLTFDGTKAVSFSSVTVGPTGTAKRRLIASRAIQSYNGNTEAYEMFFVPGGTINNNTATTLSNVDFWDADLVDSADYTYNQLSEIPSVVFISPYGSRVCYGGPNSDKNLVYISSAGEPESISSTAGFISCDPFESEGVKDATEFRDNLYVTKGDHTYTTRDNTYEPATWTVVRLDQSIGANVNGIAQFRDIKGSKVDSFIVADQSGLFKFNGIYEEIPLSRNIKEKVWSRINKAYFNKIQVIIDQKKLLIYILLPLDGVVSPNYILVGNYENGFQLDRIKWHLWTFSGLTPSSIGVDINNTTKETVFKFGSLSGNIYGQEIDRRNDAGAAINNFIKFSLLGSTSGSISHCGAVGLRVKGAGTLTRVLYGEDDVDTQTLPSLTLATTPGKEYLQLANFQTERVSLQIGTNGISHYFKLRKAVLYINEIFATRPG